MSQSSTSSFGTPGLGASPVGTLASSRTTLSSEDGHDPSERDVAIVGLACRAPGGNNSPEELWRSILEKKDASGEMPSMRWEAYYRRDPRNPKVLDQTSSRGYYLDKLEDFDAQFFGISPKEAEQMDPQQRVSLEVAWEALENAGIPPSSLSGSDTAVFWGVGSDDYAKLLHEDLPNIEAWMGIGVSYCGVPNRISYHLNLMGPSSAVDGACASGLVAVHHGAQAVLSGESQVAIVGGVNALCGPGHFKVLDAAGAVSPEGCCRSFDDEARGYGRGEGAGAIILKNKSQAIRDGDHILAILKGSAVAHDGKTNGIMAPNAEAQQLVAQNCLGVAGVDPLTVRYVEAHATSTPLGDPTEVSAISAVYGSGRPKEDPCFVGSIKPNIGHLEAGAGAMGLIKAVMALQKGVLPPQANLKTLNKRIDWDTAGIKVVQDATKWPSTDEVRRAAVCSYGYGGTVSHAVIEKPTFAEQPSPLSSSATPGPLLLLLSGTQEKRLSLQARSLEKWMKSNGQKHDLRTVAAALAVRRDHHDHRAAVVVDSQEDAVHVLSQLAENSNHPWVTQSRVLGSDVNKDVVWVFSGHGAQWPDMGKELLRNSVFLAAIQPLDNIVVSEAGLSPISLLQSGQFDSSDHVQILTYIMQIGISAVLNSQGLYPQAVIGHSVGEIAASVIAGAITAKEGTLLTTRRAILYRQVMGQGGMIVVQKPFAEVSQELHGRDDLVAAIDASPSSTVISGSSAAVAQVRDEYKQRGLKVATVKTDIAFHSPMLNTLVEPLVETLDGRLSPRLPHRARLYSTSLKDPRGQDLRDQAYWVRNMVSPVHLTSAVQAAVEDSYRIFLEVSSHPVVSHSINETLMHAEVEDFCVVPTLKRNKPSEKSILYATAQLHCQGAAVDWKAHMPGPWAGGLPNTTWVHVPAWRKVETAQFNAAQTHVEESHNLLGERIAVAGTNTVVYTTKLDTTTKPFPGEHPVHGTEIIPAACLITTFLKAARANVLEDVNLKVPVAINTPISVQVVVQQNEVKIMSRLLQEGKAAEESAWATNTTCRWAVQDTSPEDLINIEAVKARIGTRLPDDFSKKYLEEVGVTGMGFPWASTEQYGNTQEMLARVDAAPDVASDAPLPWDPSSWASILDAATSIGSTIYSKEPGLRMLGRIQRLDFYARNDPPKMVWLYVQEASHLGLAAHVTILDDTGRPLAKLTGMLFSAVEGEPGTSGGMEGLVHQLAWPPAMPTENPLTFSQVVLVSSDVALREKYAATIPTKLKTHQVSSAANLATDGSLSLDKNTAIVYLPGIVSSMHDVPASTEENMWQALEVIKTCSRHSLPGKVFIVTSKAGEGATPTALAHAPLAGLSRILSSEHPDEFGCHVDTEEEVFPLTALRYIQGDSVIRVRDGVARTARLRSLPRDKLLRDTKTPRLLPKADGTYLITGGLGALGLAVAEFLVEKGARRLVLVSRRSLPTRKTWDNVTGDMAHVIAKIRELERQGAYMHVLALDIGKQSAAQELPEALDKLLLPPVRGVVHAAGVLNDQLALDTTRDGISSVLTPKVTGSLVLDEVFPARSVDFFVLFSSCGHLVGSTGQTAYGSANAFLDALARRRKNQGDRSVAFQWTAWRGMGMGASTDFIKFEFDSKGITDVTRDEAFGAWTHLGKYDMDHAVVLRSRPLEDGEPVPIPIITDIAIRRVPVDNGTAEPSSGGATGKPGPGVDLKTYLDQEIRNCVGRVLQIAPEDIDTKTALSDLGMDSVMTVNLRGQLQKTLKVQIPPTLTWSYPTVKHLVGWFEEKLAKD